jgi:serine/threonine protein kinase/Tol biopolymer transport system component
MALANGTKLGPYEIQSPLGAGGMGEVYRARDTRLGRDVALKILPESFASDGSSNERSTENDRLHRFEQESRAVAALNHPNILAIYDVGQHNGTPFLVSELLEGETLRVLLNDGSLSQRKTIEYGVQIAHGLAAAHEKGIVHRDLKPENLFLTKDGRVKILDFGLAKLTEKQHRSAIDGVTLTSTPTAVGTVMGTASYMAPEQVRGQGIDPRTDIFAFGAVLFEMLSGKRAFQRDSPVETMAAVLKEDPPELADPSHPISPALDRIIRRCLEKNPEQRFQSAKDLSFALDSLSGTTLSGPVQATSAPHRFPRMFPVMIAVALAAVAVATWFFAKRPAPQARMQFAIPVAGEVSHMALSADGTMLAFISPDESSGIPMLNLQHVGSPGAIVLPGTAGATYPFWSPDGAYIAFFANGKLEKISASGGPPQVLTNVLAARGGSWGSRGVIIFSPDASSAVWRVNADGTGRAPVTDLIMVRQDSTHRWPTFLPDGNHFLFLASNFTNAKDDRTSGIYASSLDGKEKNLVVLCRSSFGVGSGRLFYADDERQLVSMAFDSSSRTVSGSAVVIASLVGFQPSTYWTALTTAENGTVIYNSSRGGARSAMTWMDRAGKELGRVGEPGVMCNPSLSPDGNRVALDISDEKANNIDIWIVNTNAPGSSRFTFNPAEEVVGVWSRDGKTIAYRVNITGGSNLELKPATGLEPEKGILQTPISDDIIPNSWSPFDRQILWTHQTPSGSHLELTPVGGGESKRFLTSQGSESNGQISPDGKWVAYASDESGNWEIYVTTFPGGAGKWQVSTGGGAEPRWRGDGNELFYIGASGMLTAVPVITGTSFTAGTPTPLFQIHGRAAISSTDAFTYDVAKDGKRFLVNRYVKPEQIAPLNIVLNATAQP